MNGAAVTATVYAVAFGYILVCGVIGHREQKRLDAELERIANPDDPF